MERTSSFPFGATSPAGENYTFSFNTRQGSTLPRWERAAPSQRSRSSPPARCTSSSTWRGISSRSRCCQEIRFRTSLERREDPPPAVPANLGLWTQTVDEGLRGLHREVCESLTSAGWTVVLVLRAGGNHRVHGVQDVLRRVQGLGLVS